MKKRIGFACKYMHHDQTLSTKLLEEKQKHLSERSTTITWLNNQKRDVAEERLWEIMAHNFQAAYNLVKYVGGLPDELRMVRLGSNQLPAYTESDWSYFWRKPDVRQVAERGYAKVGDLARSLDVRMSMHPGQFTVLASDNDDIVNRSIEEFEYHCDLIRWMGFGQQWQDFKCNVHISGRRGPAGIIDVLSRLSPEARNSITIENDENSWGIDASLELEKHVALVLDLHHHWCHSEGEYIEPNDTRVARVIDSWRGVRPVLHYSVSREEYLHNHPTGSRPDYTSLLASGHKKAKLRAHSDYYWNTAVNDWALSFSDNFDIMCESKMKNLASIQLHNQAKSINTV
jgi:UV DNA damage repair endonuclease